MITFKELLLENETLLDESVYDKGIFKCVFFAGLPGAGKTYVSSKIDIGNISPRVVNFDKYAEFLGKSKISKDYDVGRSDFPFVDKSKTMTTKQLALYINSMLPLMVDTTSNKISRTLMRNGILKQFGYDTGMVWIQTDFKTALDRISKRQRSVPESYVKAVYDEAEKNKEFYKKEFSDFFIEVNNNEGILTDELLLTAAKKCSSFYTAPSTNPIAGTIINKAKNGYMVPNVFRTIGDIENKLTNWY